MIETDAIILAANAHEPQQHFQRSLIPKFDKQLNRDAVDVQLKKVCFACGRGFCKRKGRAKAEQVANVPGRFVCRKCADALLAGEASDRVKVIDQG